MAVRVCLLLLVFMTLSAAERPNVLFIVADLFVTALFYARG